MAVTRSIFQRSPVFVGLLVQIAVLSGCTPALIGGIPSGDVALTGFLYSDQIASYPLNVGIPTNVPSFATGTATSFTISPALPTGLSLDTSTGRISGTPTAASSGAASGAFTSHTVTARNSLGSITTVVRLLAMDGFYVNSTAWDGTAATSDATPGNGICATPGGTCTLKAAVQEYNALAAASRLIYLSDGTYSIPAGQSIVPATGASRNLILCGGSSNNVIIDGGNVTYLFDVVDTDITVCNVTLRNGNESVGSGAGFYFGPTLANKTANLSYVNLLNNTAAQWGGAIQFNGSDVTDILNIDHCYFEGNTATLRGGAIDQFSFGTTNISNSTFYNNSAGTSAGAIEGFTSAAVINISNSTFRSNTSGGTGGAIQAETFSTLSILNSTFYGNSASGGIGGALNLISTGSTHDIRFSTFYNNTSSTAAGGGAIAFNGGTLTTRANIFVGNLANGAANHCRNSAGTWTGQGYSVFESTGGLCGSAGTGDVSTATPGLTTIAAYNGGEILNLAITAGSPAADLVPLASCVDNLAAALALDTRNFPRPSGGSCDAGAFEL